MSAAMARFTQKLQNAQQNFASRGGYARGPVMKRTRREWTRQVVKVSRWDQIEWTGNAHETDDLFTTEDILGVRNDPEVDAAIRDIFYGNTKDPEERPPYLNGPELLQDIFMAFMKAAPETFKKVEVVKDARLNQKFILQMMDLPAYEEVHDYTVQDADTAKAAMLAFVDVLKDLIRQHREAVEESNQQREDSGTDPKGQPGNQDNKPKYWEDVPPPKSDKSEKGDKGDQGENGDQGDQGDGQQSPGANQDKGDEGGKSQFGDKEPGEGDDDSDGEAQPDWDYHDDDDNGDPANPDEGKGQDGAGGGEGDQGDDDTDADGDGEGDDAEAQMDQVEREFNEDYLDEEYDAESDWEQMVDGIDMGRFANRALEAQAEEIGELTTARRGVGLDDAEWKMMDPKARLDMAKRLNTPRMKAIADMVGRMKRFAMSKQATKIIDAPHEIFTVEMGNDLRRVLRSEYGLLGTPETSIEFYRKYLNGELLQYKERGHEDVGKGPIICCIDNSGSMSGTPENWAKGVAEALRRICQDQGRDFHAIYFETNRHRERFDFPEGKGPFDKVMAFLGISAGGGTEFDGVLTEALNKAQTFFAGKASQGKSDIVFITDGEAYLDANWVENFNKERKEAGVRVFSIYISAYDSSRSGAMKLLESFSDTAIPVKALEIDDDTTSQLFSQI